MTPLLESLAFTAIAALIGTASALAGIQIAMGNAGTFVDALTGGDTIRSTMTFADYLRWSAVIWAHGIVTGLLLWGWWRYGRLR